MPLTDRIIDAGPYEPGQVLPPELVREVFKTGELNALRDELVAARQMRELLTDLADPDPCWFDHHGYCQAHGWMATDPHCPHARAKELLAELSQRADEHTEVCR